MTFVISRVQPDTVREFYARTEREALKAFYGFPVVWHEQSHDVVAFEGGFGGRIVAAANVRVAASLAHVERIVVLPDMRRRGLGRALLSDASELANYYNCHKLSAQAPHRSAAQQFFEACGYREEAVLLQHAFKLDVAVLRLFLM